MKFHPFSEVFPLLTGDLLTELVEDIRANGLREPIWRYNGQILDGRNRFLACQKAKVKPRYRDYDGNDPLAFVVSLNIQRRHLSDAQRAFAAHRIATMRQGERTDLASRDARSQSDAAQEVGTSRSSVQRAKKVAESGSKALQKAAESGEVSLRKAASVVNLPKSEQLAAAITVPEFKIVDYDEAGDDEAIVRAEMELAKAFDAITASDNRFAAFQSEIKRLTSQLAVTERSRDHYQNQAGEAVRLLKAEQRKVAALEKKLERLEGKESHDRAPAVGMQ